MKSIIVVGLLALSIQARAQKHEISVKLLNASPLSKVSTARGSTEDGRGGLGFALEYAHPVYKRLSLGGEFSLMPRGETGAGSLLGPAIDLRVSGETMAFLALARVDAYKGERFTAYAAGGLGMASVSRRAVAKPINGATWTATGTRDERAIVDSSAWVPAWALRGGFDARVGDRYLLGLELGYFGTSDATHGPTAEGKAVLGDFTVSAPSESFTVALKAGVRF